MKKITHLVAMTLPVFVLSACGEPKAGFEQAFPDLASKQLEIRMGQTPGLDPAKCNRNMYAGFRTDEEAPVTLKVDLVATAVGISMQRYTRELVLDGTSRDDLLAGQTPLFPETLDVACPEVTVRMLTMECLYGSDQVPRACPGSRKWQWLQGFKEISVPKAR